MAALVPLQDVHGGREAFARDLATVLKGASLTERGWAAPNDLTLLVPLFPVNAAGNCDAYLLRLFFDHYSNGPPSAQFVNPLTLSYVFPNDVMWVPCIAGHPSIAFHTNFNNSLQLICSSTTLEFYKVNHAVAEEHLWRTGQMTFLSTLAAIRAGLAPPYYKGRSAR
ncbi:MAG TPA: hypothetical protein VMV40_04985 [Acidiferrobacter sp.]|nr:hypothetical protein [Acidiferrobacter sp.]